jgi:putative SOS response-associated peptidase YedK
LFGDLVVRQRCIVPVSGFFEWKTGTGKLRQPLAIHLREARIMSVAGIWDSWRPGTLDERRSFSIVTTRANDFMSTIHDRMPVILSRSDEDAWLDPEVHEREILEKLLLPCPSSWLTAYEVSNLVNSPKNDSPDLLKPAQASEKIAVTPRLF